jgi:hypothetical protein
MNTCPRSLGRHRQDFTDDARNFVQISGATSLVKFDSIDQP